MSLDLIINRDHFLAPLQKVVSVVEKKQTMPVLGNILLRLDGGRLHVTGSDSEVQLDSFACIPPQSSQAAITVAGRKLVEVCRGLPDLAELKLKMQGTKLLIRSGKSRFCLSTLPADEFPLMEQKKIEWCFEIPQSLLRHILNKTSFAMAQKDVRYYLNSGLLEITSTMINSVATDAHRLALCSQNVSLSVNEKISLLVPRKSVIELMRLLDDTDTPVKLEGSSAYLRVSSKDYVFTSKLMEGDYPNYQQVIPKKHKSMVLLNTQTFKSILQRVAILSSEKSKGVRLSFSHNKLEILTHNPEQESGEENILISYDGEPLEIDFNVYYLIDVLNAIDEPNTIIGLGGERSSILLNGEKQLDQSQYVVMPMRL